MEWPQGKSFAFTIIDDTDNGNVENTKPIYDFLYDNGLITTKTVWVYPPRDMFSGGCLEGEDYSRFIGEIQSRGYEIALHCVGSGRFGRSEIIEGLELFREKTGYYPRIQINHSYNPDNIYWGYKRYGSVLGNAMRLLYGAQKAFLGDEAESEHFWGDVCKKRIKYMRNHIFNGINTCEYDPRMPYRAKDKLSCSNYWFSSSDGETAEEFNNLIAPGNLDYLERSGGFCIVYTHFSLGFMTGGRLNDTFKKHVSYLSSKNGWFVPAGTLLDHLLARKTADEPITGSYQNKLDFLWLVDRVRKKFRYRR